MQLYLISHIYLQKREVFVKYNYFHKVQRLRYTPDPFHAESLHYTAEKDYYVCPMGQYMNHIGTKRDKTANKYMTESDRYKACRRSTMSNKTRLQ